MKSSKNLNCLFKKMSKNETPHWLDVMSAISDVTNLVTLTERPPGRLEPITICELNGKNCCGD